MKLLFLCKERLDSGSQKSNSYEKGYNRSIGLVNSAQFIVNFLTEQHVDCKLCTVVDANSIDKEVFSYQPTHVILEALWITPDKLRELLSLKRYSNITWIIRIHSKITFIANEGIAFPWLVGYQGLMQEFKNLHLSVNSSEFSDDLNKVLHARSIYLPNVYYPGKHRHPKKIAGDKNHVDIACFGAIRPMKNQLIQAIAAIKYGDEVGQTVHFHVNADRLEQSGDNVYKNLRALFSGTKHLLIDHPWVSHSEFLEVIATMDLGLQVSLTETFNIVTADFITMGIPIIGSHDIDWLPEMFRANPTSSEDILHRMKLIMDTESVGYSKLNKIHLKWYNERAKRVWLDYLLSM